MELRSARAADPANSTYDFFYFDLLRRLSPDQAMEEVEPLASTPSAHALLLAAAVHIAIAVALKHPDADLSTRAKQALGWCDRFEHARGRDEVQASLLSLVMLDRGLLLLGLGEIHEARHAFGLAGEIYPGAAFPGEVAHLTGFDQSARAIAAASQRRPLAADYRNSVTAA